MNRIHRLIKSPGKQRVQFLPLLLLALLPWIGFSQPRNFEEVGFISLPYDCQSLEVTNETAFVSIADNSLVHPYQVLELNISNPAQPVHCRNARLSDFPVDGAVLGPSVYYQATSTSIDVFDVSERCNPVLSATLELQPQISSTALALSEGTLWVAERRGRINRYDLSDPLHPALLGFLETGTEATDIYLSAPRAYLAEGSGGLGVFDASGEGDLEWIGSAWADSSSQRIAPIRKGLAVAGENIHLFVLADDGTPHWVGSTPMAQEVIIATAPELDLLYALVNNSFDPSLLAFDISHPDQPRLLGVIPDPGGQTQFHLAAHGRRVCVLAKTAIHHASPSRFTIWNYTGPTSTLNAHPQDFAGDLDKSGRVDSRDLLMLRQNWYEETAK